MRRVASRCHCHSGALRSARLIRLWHARGPLRSSGGAGSVRGPALLATVAGDEPGSEAEGWRSPGSREPGRGVRHSHCHPAVQSPRPGSLVAEPTGIGRSRGRASSRPVSAGSGGGEGRARDASVKDLFRSALEPREHRHTSCSNRQRHATACSMQHATADTMGGVPVRFAARATWTATLSDLGQDAQQRTTWAAQVRVAEPPARRRQARQPRSHRRLCGPTVFVTVLVQWPHAPPPQCDAAPCRSNPFQSSHRRVARPSTVPMQWNAADIRWPMGVCARLPAAHTAWRL
jgi:hypothetical protein